MDDNGWKFFKYDNQSYIVRRNFSEANFKILLSDYRRLWCTEGTASELLQMSQSENPYCEFEEIKITKNIFSLFDKSVDSLSVTRKDEKIRILKMSTSLGHRPFTAFWTLSDQGSDALFEEVTRPLLMFTYELSRRQHYLCQELRDKDREINEYILENGKRTRGRIKTESFDTEEWKADPYKCYSNFDNLDPIESLWDSNMLNMFNKRICEKKKEGGTNTEKETLNLDNVSTVKQEENIPERTPEVSKTMEEVIQVKEEKPEEPSTTRSKRKKVKLNL